MLCRSYDSYLLHTLSIVVSIFQVFFPSYDKQSSERMGALLAMDAAAAGRMLYSKQADEYDDNVTVFPSENKNILETLLQAPPTPPPPSLPFPCLPLPLFLSILNTTTYHYLPLFLPFAFLHLSTLKRNKTHHFLFLSFFSLTFPL